MTRQVPAQYALPPLDFDYQPFDVRAVRRILVKAGVRATPDMPALIAACKQLNQAAQWLRMQGGRLEAPTVGAERETLERLRKLAAALLAELPIVDEESLYGGPDGPRENPRVIDGVARLLVATMDRLMEERVKRERDERGRGPDKEAIFGAGSAADALLLLTELLDLLRAAAETELETREGLSSAKATSPLREFTLAAAQVYLQLSGEPKLSLSRKAPGQDGGRLQGPLIRFLQGCCHQVGATGVELETLADWVRKAKRARKGATQRTSHE